MSRPPVVRALMLIAVSLDVPGLRRLAAAVAPEPIVEELAEATLFRPRRRPPHPAIVVVTGATALGRRHPAVVRMAAAFARAGHLVLVPDVPGLDRLQVSEPAVERVVAVAAALAQRDEARGGRVGLVGVSVGGSVALLAAEDERLATRVSAVVALVAYTDLVEMLRLATTGHYRAGSTFVAYGPAPGLTEVLTASLPAAGMGELLENRDPHRFDDLFAALPEETRKCVDRLSPLAGAARLSAPVELVITPRDKYFPPAQAYALAAAAPNVRVTVTGALEHADRAGVTAVLRELTSLTRFVMRTLGELSR